MITRTTNPGAATRGLAHELVERLKERILSGDLRPGDRLPSETLLVADFGVSRTVVREAVAGLQAAGLVETFQGRGSFVTALPKVTEFSTRPAQVRTHRDVVALLEFRLGVETEAAGLAAQRRTDRQLRSIERALTDYKSCGAEPVDADYRFHHAVVVASGNRFYVDLIGSLGPMMIMMPRTRLRQEYTVADATHFNRVTLEHENVYLAIARSDPDGARAAMRLHLSNTLHRLRPAP